MLCTAPPRPVLLPFLSSLDYPPHAHAREEGRQPKLLTPPLLRFAALEASSPVQLHSSTLPLLPLCLKIKSLNPGDLNWKLHPEVCLTPGYNLSFSKDISHQSSSKNLLLRGGTSLGQHPNPSKAERGEPACSTSSTQAVNKNYPGN